MPADNVLINVAGISFAYPARPVLFDGLDFALRSGERVGVVGANGSGKTTLFHIIMGLHKPRAGRIDLLGERMLCEKDFRRAREKIGLLFQDSDDQLFCPTVEEDIAFGPLNLGASHARAREIVGEVLDDIGMSGFARRITHRLSAGEKRMISLATVLAMRPDVLLLDEPTAGLSEEFTRRLQDILTNMNSAYAIISHDKEFLAAATTRLYRLEGRPA